jgi:hypothetical protein
VTNKKFAQWALVGFSENFIHREATDLFVNGQKAPEVKQHFVMGRKKSLNEALNQAVKLQVAKAVVRPTAKVPEVRVAAPMRIWSPETERSRTQGPISWQCGDIDHLRRDCQQRHDEEADHDSKTSKSRQEFWPLVSPSFPRFIPNVSAKRTTTT